MSSWETITLDQDNVTKGVFVLTLNRPRALNALNTQMAIDLIDCMEQLKEKEDVRVLVLTASGEKGFCVGADLKERDGMTNSQWKHQHDIFESAYKVIREFPYPVIVAINGFALGGGMELTLSCDLRIAADHAKMGLPEVTLGIIPGVGGTQLLPRTIPVGFAKELLFRGNHITANEAKELGLVNEVAPISELLDKTLEIARDIGKNSPIALKSIKQSINNGLQTDINTALTIELDQYYKCANSEDRLEGIKAFNEKRQPVWQGK